MYTLNTFGNFLKKSQLFEEYTRKIFDKKKKCFHSTIVKKKEFYCVFSYEL